MWGKNADICSHNSSGQKPDKVTITVLWGQERKNESIYLKTASRVAVPPSMYSHFNSNL